MTGEKMNILKDKVIVVVGASSGIGAAISEYFCDHGAITCIFGRRKERLEKLCDRAKEKNQRMYPYTGDARNYSNLARMAEQMILEGELRGLTGRLIECFDRENLTEMKKNENTEWGLLRIIN